MPKYQTYKFYNIDDVESVTKQDIMQMWDSTDSIIGWTVGESEGCEVSKRLDDWLLANGASDHEEVLIRLYW